MGYDFKFTSSTGNYIVDGLIHKISIQCYEHL